MSFKAVVDDLENEINQLYQDFNYCKKEVHILKSEEDTVKDMS